MKLLHLIIKLLNAKSLNFSMFIYALKFIKTMKIQLLQHLEKMLPIKLLLKPFNLTKDSIQNVITGLH